MRPAGPRPDVEALIRLVTTRRPLVVLTGAGVSAASGIPTYRDDRGEWQRGRPIQHQEFVADPAHRRRYWARSLAGWATVAGAAPGAAHQALARLEQLGLVTLLVTQNVDRLHQRAGHQRVVDLHGRLDRVRCLSCGAHQDRDELQATLLRLNPSFDAGPALPRPDGDALVDDTALSDFQVPGCTRCAGLLMPDVVFFGGQVPKPRVREVTEAVARAGLLLVVGSSLMVYSGFRFCRQAAREGTPIAIVNRGVTRADDVAAHKVSGECGTVLRSLAARLS